MPVDLWNNQELFPFLLDGDDRPCLLSYIGIDNIDWEEEKAQICEHCGATHTGSTCPGCGNPAPGKTIYSLGSAIATLSGPMPVASNIFHLPTGATIDILHRYCGPRDVYTECNVVMRLLNCRVIKRSMPNLCYVTQELVRLYVSVECEVELYPEGIANAH